jgi:hypothetical protein
MLPVKSNLTDKACGEPIGSNCVIWTGAPISGTCGISTLTDVITAINQNCCGSTTKSPCYTGNWIDFSSSIPGSGVGGGFTWTLGSFGLTFPTLTGAENTPQYKWTSDGDLKVRGSMFFNVNVSGAITDTFLKIPLCTISTDCFPANANRAQTAIIGTDAFVVGNQINIVTRAFLTIVPSTGILYLNFSFATVTPSSFGVGMYLGGTTFNLA